MLDQFDRIHVVNIVERTDRRREMEAQLARVGLAGDVSAGDGRVRFFPARRPADAGPFPSVGARGCFESQLGVIRAALADGVARLLLLEDDLDFAPDIAGAGPPLFAALAAARWDLFYGASRIEPGERPVPGPDGLARLAPAVAVTTAACVGFTRAALARLEPFLTAMAARPPGSPDWGPMHVDGAYSVFRAVHPDVETLAALPPVGDQRASRSDITPNNFLLDRFALTRPLANRLRRVLARR